MRRRRWAAPAAWPQRVASLRLRCPQHGRVPWTCLRLLEVGVRSCRAAACSFALCMQRCMLERVPFSRHHTTSHALVAGNPLPTIRTCDGLLHAQILPHAASGAVPGTVPASQMPSAKGRRVGTTSSSRRRRQLCHATAAHAQTAAATARGGGKAAGRGAACRRGRLHRTVPGGGRMPACSRRRSTWQQRLLLGGQPAMGRQHCWQGCRPAWRSWREP